MFNGVERTYPDVPYIDQSWSELLVYVFLSHRKDKAKLDKWAVYRVVNTTLNNWSISKARLESAAADEIVYNKSLF